MDELMLELLSIRARIEDIIQGPWAWSDAALRERDEELAQLYKREAEVISLLGSDYEE